VRVVANAGGTRIEPPSTAGLHVFGHARGGVLDRLGFGLFAVTMAGVALHAAIRSRAGGARRVAREPTRRVYLYTVYERLWHWLMAAGVLALLATGLQIHFAGSLTPLSLPRAVAAHNVFAVVVAVNGFLSLFYHVTTSAIRHYLPDREGLLARLAAQARFYTSGIFLGGAHPSPKSPRRKLNPLQQVMYLALLNVLFPLQLVTGAAIWGASRWPALADRLGGLAVVAPLHGLGAWVFLAFLLLHLYLATTGVTAWAGVRAMIDGHDEVPSHLAAEEGGARG
jgi:thiosulfate reductase cytochrome b subunit